jgi:hypothetical protein
LGHLLDGKLGFGLFGTGIPIEPKTGEVKHYLKGKDMAIFYQDTDGVLKGPQMDFPI